MSFLHLNIDSEFIKVDVVVRDTTANKLLIAIKDLQRDVYCPSIKSAKTSTELDLLKGQKLDKKYTNVKIAIKPVP